MTIFDDDFTNDVPQHDETGSEAFYEHHDSTFTPGATGEDDDMHGLPSDTEHWDYQSMNGFCAPNAVACIAESFLGYDIPEADVVGRAACAGLIHPEDFQKWSGMNLDGCVKLLEEYGIPSHVEHGSIESLEQYLDAGHKILLPVNAHEIWYGTNTTYRPDHAIALVGIDRTNPAHPEAIINDSGVLDGASKRIPLSVLEDAWDDSGHTMVVTDISPEGFSYNILGINHDRLLGEIGTSPTTDSLKGYYNADGTYHYTSDNTDRDVETGKVVRRW